MFDAIKRVPRRLKAPDFRSELEILVNKADWVDRDSFSAKENAWKAKWFPLQAGAIVNFVALTWFLELSATTKAVRFDGLNFFFSVIAYSNCVD